MNELMNLTKKELIDILFNQDKNIKKIFENSKNIGELRESLFFYLNHLERKYFNIFKQKNFKKLHIVDKNVAKECIRIFKNIIRTENEKISNTSALFYLSKLYKKDEKIIKKIEKGFIFEILFLIKGINAKHKKNKMKILTDEQINAKVRCEILDKYSKQMYDYFKKYRSGTHKKSIENQKKMKEKILKYFNAKESDWKDYKWHLKNIISDYKTLNQLVNLTKQEKQGIMFAKKNNIPFQITPYYLSLFNFDKKDKYDRLVRAQVIPSKKYCEIVKKNREKDIDMDFMKEKSTSPIDLITRRYPNIVILKPYDSCPQICVYCQRNWEITGIKQAKKPQEKINKAIKWIKENKYITEVLVTGGDPLTLDNDYIFSLLEKLNKISHVQRIRIGSRLLVTIPFRINDDLIKILKKYNCLGKKEICIMTHFEDAYEITKDTIKILKKIKKAGINVYNQQVFTYYNSFKYMGCFLRTKLKISGIDPYYSFNTKGKQETLNFRVPIARIQQERKEEARLLPGVVRVDESVFNVPKLGKSHLRSWQDHEVIMINEKGNRIYRFYPWESMLLLVDDYIYEDVSIYEYLKKLKKDDEKLSGYESIWYYF